MPGGAGGQVATLDQQRFTPAQPGEPVEYRGSDNASTDDGNLYVLLHGALVVIVLKSRRRTRRRVLYPFGCTVENTVTKSSR